MLIGPVFLLSFMATLSIAYAANDLVHCETQCSTELQNCILRDATSADNRLRCLDIYYPCAYSCTENSFTNAPAAINAAVLHAAEIAKCDSHCNTELQHCLYHNLSLSQQCLTVYYSCVSFCSVNPEAQNVVTDAPTLKSTYLQHLSTQKTPQTQPTITLIPSSTLTSTIKPVVTDAPSTTSYPPSVASTAKTTAPHHATGRSTILAWVTLPRQVNKH